VSGVLGIGAVALLVGLGLLSLKRRRETVALEKQRAGARSHTGEAQHERSRIHRAAVRSALQQTEQAAAQAEPAEPARSAG
jgi:hypothetical protein